MIITWHYFENHSPNKILTVFFSRPLRDGEIFEIVIERTVDRWSGSIEAGVTLIRPEDLEFPNTVYTHATCPQLFEIDNVLPVYTDLLQVQQNFPKKQV